MQHLLLHSQRPRKESPLVEGGLSLSQKDLSDGRSVNYFLNLEKAKTSALLLEDTGIA